MILITGDTHGTWDIDKFRYTTKLLTPMDPEKPNYMIIAGDFGMIWNESYAPNQINTKDEASIRRVYEKKPWITLWVDGNHENFDVIDSLPVTEKWGGKVHEITPYCYHLMRGEVYEIDGVKFLALGGGLSVDKGHRREGVSWWPQEEMTEDQVENAKANLAKHNNEVDFVVSHACPAHVLPEFEAQLPAWDLQYWGPKREDKTCARMTEATKDARYKSWYFGHYHEERIYRDNTTGVKYYMLYQGVMECREAKV